MYGARSKLSCLQPSVSLVQTFLLKVTKRNMDGTTTIVKTVPCDGSNTHTCLVEVSPGVSARRCGVSRVRVLRLWSSAGDERYGQTAEDSLANTEE